MRILVAVCVSTVLAVACAGIGRSRPSPPRPIRLAARFGDDVGLHVRFPRPWYAQPYADTNLLITSFPVHVDDGRVWRAVPRGGTVIQIYDQPSGTLAACNRLGGPHAHVRLGRYEPNYEGIGPAFRAQFHDGGHTVLVFTSFGPRRPTRAQRLLAGRILNSIHVDRGACPVKAVVAIGRRARQLSRLLERARANGAPTPRRRARAP